MKALLWCALTIGFLCVGVSAQAELDTTFNSTGKLVILAQLSATTDMAVQPDNKIVMISNCNTMSGSFQFCLVRVNENGALDDTFGAAGRVYTNFQTFANGVARGLAIQPDGKLTVVGYSAFTGIGDQITLARYHANGSLDDSFGSGGKVVTDISPGDGDRAQKVALQPDGKIVVVGYSANAPGTTQQFVARYLANGTLDTTFGTGGIVRTSIAGHSTWGESIALQADGRILVGGHMLSDPGAPVPSASYLVIRLNADGSLDATWDDDGIRVIVYGTSGLPETRGVRSLAIQADGRVIALGHTNILYRFNPDGSLDASFDGDGSRAALNGTSDPYDVMVSSGGRITVVGGPTGSPLLYRVARYQPNGSPDTSFSGDGFLDFDMGGGFANHGARAVAVDPQGRTVIAGLSANGPPLVPFQNAVFSVARLTAPTASAVGISGRVTRPDGRAVPNAFLTIDIGGGTIITALTNPFGYYHFVNVLTGQTYTISARAKRFVFTDRSVFVGDQVANFDFVAEP